MGKRLERSFTPLDVRFGFPSPLKHLTGFTLVELVIVIAIIGILAAIAIPRFIDIRTEAYNAQGDGIIGSVRAGILTVASRNQVDQQTGTFPPNLEATWNLIVGGTLSPNGTACAAATPCFELVVPGGFVSSSWVQTTATSYTYTPPQGLVRVCTYTQANGTFRGAAASDNCS